ncbi:ribosome recycling factor [Tindallia californiensis]|uniref:Ribosome-recycling factor n=1 Tax=Tindallia californiensis TaxID=159292 RepID=A0A1H3NPX6_9FIRM|nr:ribosome recycling factor [Tindallia californiensis]SDY90884.1 ribosome recycling factor [Tindallia californiensis]
MQLEIHKAIEEKMSKTVNVVNDEFKSIRAGRANPAMLDRITVEYYGAVVPLNQVATISTPEPRMISIQPFDVSSLKEIEKAIQKSDLGINPSTDGKIIRLIIPQLTEERRKDLIKIVKAKAEEGRVAIRNERRWGNDSLKKMEKDGELTEDDLKQAQDEVQKLTDAYIQKIENLLVTKEKEILEV